MDLEGDAVIRRSYCFEVKDPYCGNWMHLRVVIENGEVRLEDEDGQCVIVAGSVMIDDLSEEDLSEEEDVQSLNNSKWRKLYESRASEANERGEHLGDETEHDSTSSGAGDEH